MTPGRRPREGYRIADNETWGTRAAKFPASAAFDAINSVLTDSEASRKDAIKQGNAVFAFTLKNNAGETESWHIDLKDKGQVGKGLGAKPNGTLITDRTPQPAAPPPPPIIIIIAEKQTADIRFSAWDVQ